MNLDFKLSQFTYFPHPSPYCTASCSLIAKKKKSLDIFRHVLLTKANCFPVLFFINCMNFLPQKGNTCLRTLNLDAFSFLSFFSLKKTLLYSRMRINGSLNPWPPVFLRICKGGIAGVRSYFGSGHPDII